MEYSPIATPAQSAAKSSAPLFAAAGLIVVGATLLLTTHPSALSLYTAAPTATHPVMGSALRPTTRLMGAGNKASAASAATGHLQPVVAPRVAQSSEAIPKLTLAMVSAVAAVVGFFFGSRSHGVSASVAMASATATKNAVKRDAAGLDYVDLVCSSGAKARVFLYGADVTSYVDASGTEWIAVRPDAKMDGSKPISGGLSHCFPQFGPGPMQLHGFARNLNWTVHHLTNSSVTLELLPSEYTRKMWPYEFRCRFTVTVRPECLDTHLKVDNNGDPFKFQAALHSYLDVSSLANVTVSGSFAGKTFINKMVDPPAKQVETRSAITIAEEYDRVYLGVNDPVLTDKNKGESLAIVNRSGYKDTVIWSPYGNTGMGYDRFLCVESVAFDPIELAAGESWEGSMSLVPQCSGWSWCPLV